ncbi:MAG: hypothetical protein MK100_01250 [Phycisphaerales bacterium]|nr:hypothetical protein [Phycisphaerales bacterium]
MTKPRYDYTCLSSGILAMTLVTGAAVSAGAPEVMFSIAASGDGSGPVSGMLSDLGAWAELDDGSTAFTGNIFGESWHVSWTTVVHQTNELLTLDSALSITNTSNQSQMFELDTLFNPDPIFADGLFEVAANISVMNLDFTGTAELSTVDDAALIRAGLGEDAVVDLYEPFYALIATGPYAIALDNQSDQMTVSGDVESSWHGSTFELSSGDLATLHTYTVISAIPSPGAIALLAIAGWINRRRAFQL